MAQVKDLAAAELVIDEMIAEQPLIKPAVGSPRGVVASGNPLASQAGADVLERGGNVVDAGIADGVRARRRRARRVGPRRRRPGDSVSQGHDRAGRHRIQGHDAEPRDARQPEAVHADRRRTATDGPTVANIPGIVAGLDLLYQKYGEQEGGVGGSRRAGNQARRRGLHPRRGAADDDRGGPRLVREVSGGREDLSAERHACRRPGDRFVNKDYAETLRVLAKEGGDSFYRGIDRAPHRRRHGGQRRRDHVRRSRAVPRDRTQADRGPVSRPPRLLGAAAGVRRACRSSRRCRFSTTTCRRPARPTRSDADYFHHAIEAWRVRDGGARIADPER